jgi:hypothetical protein
LERVEKLHRERLLSDACNHFHAGIVEPDAVAHPAHIPLRLTAHEQDQRRPVLRLNLKVWIRRRHHRACDGLLVSAPGNQLLAQLLITATLLRQVQRGVD